MRQKKKEEEEEEKAVGEIEEKRKNDCLRNGHDYNKSTLSTSS